MAALCALWLFTFGVWPLSHPQHDTFDNPVTWIDLALHVAGAVWFWKLDGARIRLAWFVYRKGLPVEMEYPDGTRYEWQPKPHVHEWTKASEPDVYLCGCGSTMSGDIPERTE